jgi:hypothetical protein
VRVRTQRIVDVTAGVAWAELPPLDVSTIRSSGLFMNSPPRARSHPWSAALTPLSPTYGCVAASVVAALGPAALRPGDPMTSG